MLVQRCADSYMRNGVFSEEKLLKGIFVEAFGHKFESSQNRVFVWFSIHHFSFLQNAIPSIFLVLWILCM
jgi:hypothetical protein